MPRFGRIEIRIEGAAQILECLELKGLFVRGEKEGGGGGGEKGEERGRGREGR